jgi:hypothetical protein
MHGNPNLLNTLAFENSILRLDVLGSRRMAYLHTVYVSSLSSVSYDIQ